MLKNSQKHLRLNGVLTSLEIAWKDYLDSIFTLVPSYGSKAQGGYLKLEYLGKICRS